MALLRVRELFVPGNATGAQRAGIAETWRAFAGDERGAITTDIVLILLPILLLILTIFEIGISFYFILAAQKAAQMGARFIISEDPVNTDVPALYGIDFLNNGKHGDSCFPAGGGVSPCTFPTAGQEDCGGFQCWRCVGGALGASCDTTAFSALVTEMQIVYPSLNEEDVELRYTYEELGFAGGPFHPKVEVVIQARESPIQILSLLDVINSAWQTVENDTELGPDEKVQLGRSQGIQTQNLRRVSASVFGGDNNSLNVR